MLRRLFKKVFEFFRKIFRKNENNNQKTSPAISVTYSVDTTTVLDKALRKQVFEYKFPDAEVKISDFKFTKQALEIKPPKVAELVLLPRLTPFLDSQNILQPPNKLNSQFFNSRPSFVSTDTKVRRKTTILPPVPRLPIEGIEQDPLSSQLRQLDDPNLPRRIGVGVIGGEVFINTNEEGVAETARAMKQMSLVAGGCHIGFSGWHNLDIMAQRKSARGVICDLNPENALFLYHVLKILRLNETREGFIRDIKHYINQYEHSKCVKNKGDLALAINFARNMSDDPIYRTIFNLDFDIVAQVDVELRRETSWLFSDDRYAYIRKLAQEDKIALFTGDIRSTATFDRFVQTLKSNHIPIDSVYISNIAKYMMSTDDQASFVKTVNVLLQDDHTLLIDATFNADKLEQRCITAALLQGASPHAWFFRSEKEPGLRTTGARL